MTEDIFNDLNYIVTNKNLDIITVSENLGSAFALDLKLYNNLKQINPSINIDNLEKEISKIFNLILPNNQINITSLKLKGKEDLFLILFKDISVYNVFLNKLDLAYEEIYIYKQMLNGLKDGVFLTDEKERMENYEAFIIKETLDQTKSLQEAADILNVNVSTITRKKQKYDI